MLRQGTEILQAVGDGYGEYRNVISQLLAAGNAVKELAGQQVRQPTLNPVQFR
jgi:hypothetical protein